MAAIRFDKVSRVFSVKSRSVQALEAIDLEVADRECVAIVGPSGCGKTTCLRMAAGLEFPTAGDVTVGGERVRRPGPSRAVVFQQFALFPWQSVAENISFGLCNIGLPRSVREERVRHYVDLMRLRGYEDALPHQLSGGMQQRVAIARAYALEPQVLFMDEPFGALDAQTRTVMQEELLRIMDTEPRTTLFVTHAVEEAVYLADRVVVMTKRPGRIKEIIDIKSIRERDAWRDHKQIEDVMDLASFVHLKTRIWKSLRDEA